MCHTRRISASALFGATRKNAESTRHRRTSCTPASTDSGLRLIRNQQVAGSIPAGGSLISVSYIGDSRPQAPGVANGVAGVGGMMRPRRQPKNLQPRCFGRPRVYQPQRPSSESRMKERGFHRPAKTRNWWTSSGKCSASNSGRAFSGAVAAFGAAGSPVSDAGKQAEESAGRGGSKMSWAR
jgi:hypothetical protein